MTRAEWMALRPGSIIAGLGHGAAPRLVMSVSHCRTFPHCSWNRDIGQCSHHGIHLRMLHGSWRRHCSITTYGMNDRQTFRVLRMEPRWFDPTLQRCCEFHEKLDQRKKRGLPFAHMNYLEAS